MADSQAGTRNLLLVGVPVATAALALLTLYVTSVAVCGFGDCYGSGEALPAFLGLGVVVIGAIITGVIGGSAEPEAEGNAAGVILALGGPFAIAFGALGDAAMGGGAGDYLAITIASFFVTLCVLVVVMVLGLTMRSQAKSRLKSVGGGGQRERHEAGEALDSQPHKKEVSDILVGYKGHR